MIEPGNLLADVDAIERLDWCACPAVPPYAGRTDLRGYSMFDTTAESWWNLLDCEQKTG